MDQVASIIAPWRREGEGAGIGLSEPAPVVLEDGLEVGRSPPLPVLRHPDGYCEGYWDGPSPKIEFVLIEPSPPLPRLALPAVPAKPSIKTLAFCSFLRSSSAHWSAV